MADPGLWLVNGKVSSLTARNRVWDAYYRRLAEVNKVEQAIIARHRREQAEIDAERYRVWATEPRTPWVGRHDTGPIAEFVKSGTIDVRNHKAELKQRYKTRKATR